MTNRPREIPKQPDKRVLLNLRACVYLDIKQARTDGSRKIRSFNRYRPVALQLFQATWKNWRKSQLALIYPLFDSDFSRRVYIPLQTQDAQCYTASHFRAVFQDMANQTLRYRNNLIKKIVSELHSIVNVAWTGLHLDVEQEEMDVSRENSSFHCYCSAALPV